MQLVLASSPAFLEAEQIWDPVLYPMGSDAICWMMVDTDGGWWMVDAGWQTADRGWVNKIHIWGYPVLRSLGLLGDAT